MSKEVDISPASYVVSSTGMYSSGHIPGTVPSWMSEVIDQIVDPKVATVNTDVGNLQTYVLNFENGVNQDISSLVTADSQMSVLIQSNKVSTDTELAAIGDILITKITDADATAIAENVISAEFTNGGATSSAWFNSRIQSYADNINANTSSLTTMAASVGDIDVRLTSTESVAATANSWAASSSKLITGPNDEITGWSFSDGTNVTSEFKINANKFILSDSTNSAQPFVFDTVNGVFEASTIVVNKLFFKNANNLFYKPKIITDHTTPYTVYTYDTVTHRLQGTITRNWYLSSYDTSALHANAEEGDRLSGPDFHIGFLNSDILGAYRVWHDNNAIFDVTFRITYYDNDSGTTEGLNSTLTLDPSTANAANRYTLIIYKSMVFPANIPIQSADVTFECRFDPIMHTWLINVRLPYGFIKLTNYSGATYLGLYLQAIYDDTYDQDPEAHLESMYNYTMSVVSNGH